MPPFTTLFRSPMKEYAIQWLALLGFLIGYDQSSKTYPPGPTPDERCQLQSVSQKEIMSNWQIFLNVPTSIDDICQNRLSAKKLRQKEMQHKKRTLLKYRAKSLSQLLRASNLPNQASDLLPHHDCCSDTDWQAEETLYPSIGMVQPMSDVTSEDLDEINAMEHQLVNDSDDKDVFGGLEDAEVIGVGWENEEIDDDDDLQ
ncbi:uncharacterized protein MELLADRAFT_105519 [Melampsora larici-populina 98AG31]|uniref:Uncharacterized protein n=1 Tax=Melampsora larici-populina (strain 98AG31 / pathotype 3-4-7) TaxID=747676 RepID=F4RIH2_MELLP|nr:uncharacterized protein MELLADRAFT_105519 [Melampsora larici-populina 98AG31]EGG07564.1 hypothetical protein MELLADRAFT_105519 [Melampsora larici-populina 98AG31]